MEEGGGAGRRAPGERGGHGAIELRRFADDRAVRQFALRAAAEATLLHAVALVVFGPGAKWVVERMVREALVGDRPPGGRRLPDVLTPDDLLAALGERRDLIPPRPLVRETVMDEALTVGRADPDAPPGDPALLTGPFLAFLDEQAGDARLTPGQPAFERFAARASRALEDAAEVDAGAARLLRLTRWLSRAHQRYRSRLEQLQRVDFDALRRAVLADDDGASPPGLPWDRIVALGDAFRPADLELLAALGAARHRSESGTRPRGGPRIVLAAPEDAPPPDLPPGVPFSEAEGKKADAGDLFAWTSPAPGVYVPTPRTAGGGGAAPPAEPAWVFEVTDRDSEMELAAALLRAYERDAGDQFGGFERCAIVSRRPADRLAAAEAVLGRADIPFQTPSQPALAAEPLAASVADALDFAAQPERISNGLRMLRSPFFSDPALPCSPARAADLTETALSAEGVRDTQPGVAQLEALGRDFDRRAEEYRRSGAGGGRRRRELRARAAACAASVLKALAGYAGDLAPFLEPEPDLAAAAEALRAFVEGRFGECAPETTDVREATIAALAAAREAAPTGGRSAGPRSAARSLRRVLERRRIPRHVKRSGVHLIAAGDASFGDYDFLVLLGVGDGDWPGPRPGNIFFPPRLLEPAARRRLVRWRAEEVRRLRAFATLPRRALALTRPLLEDGFPAGVSPLEADLVEALARMRPQRLPLPFPSPRGPGPEPETPTPPAPLVTHLDRRAPSARILEGATLSPTALERYARSPAEFFARSVLYLEEDAALSDIASPTERGRLLHRLLERGMQDVAAGSGPITPRTLAAAFASLRSAFHAAADAMRLSDADRTNEERWLFGDAGAPSAIEWFLREEAARGPADPVGFEIRLVGRLAPEDAGGAALDVIGTADRIDGMPDGTRRIVEYKSGRRPQSVSAADAPLQPRIYARILEANGAIRPRWAMPYFGNRQWIESSAEQDERDDERLARVREGLARGEFGLSAREPLFGMLLVARQDLPDLPTPVSPGASA